MKNIIVSLLILIAAVFSFNTAKAQNAHYNDGPCVSSDGRTISATITGLGQGTITVVCTGEADCVNPAGNEPPSWQDFSLSRDFPKRTGGNFKLNFTLGGSCNKRWSFRTQDLEITVYQNGTKVLGPTAVNSCQ